MRRIHLPWPPSVNRYWRTFRGRMIISAEGRTYKQVVAVECHGQQPLTGSLEVNIVAHRPDRRKRDLDNLLKATLDACSGHLWADDSQVHRLTIQWGRGEVVPGGLLDVMVREIV